MMLNAIFFDMFDENALSQPGQVNHHGNSFRKSPQIGTHHFIYLF